MRMSESGVFTSYWHFPLGEGFGFSDLKIATVLGHFNVLCFVTKGNIRFYLFTKHRTLDCPGTVVDSNTRCQ